MVGFAYLCGDVLVSRPRIISAGFLSKKTCNPSSLCVCPSSRRSDGEQGHGYVELETTTLDVRKTRIECYKLCTYWPRVGLGGVSDDLHLDFDGAPADRVDPHGILRARDDGEAISRSKLGEKGRPVVLIVIVVSVVGIGFRSFPALAAVFGLRRWWWWSR